MEDEFEYALTVVATVTSRPIPERGIMDAGFKRPMSDSEGGRRRPFGPAGNVATVYLSAEHGNLALEPEAQGLRTLPRPAPQPADPRPRSPPTSRPASGDWGMERFDLSGSSTVTSRRWVRAARFPTPLARGVRRRERPWAGGSPTGPYARIEAPPGRGRGPRASPPMAPRSAHFSLVDWVRPPWGRVGEHRWTGRTARRAPSTRGPGSRCWRRTRSARGSSPPGES